MNPPAIQSTIDGLRGFYTIVLALAIGEAFKQFVVDRANQPEKRHVQWDRFPGLLSFLLLIIPFYQGILTYFFKAYNHQPLPTPYGLWLSIDCLAFMFEAVLFFVLSRSLSLEQWRSFCLTVAILCIGDIVWWIVVSFANRLPWSWLVLDIATAAATLVLRFCVIKDFDFSQVKWYSWRAILLPILILARTTADYCCNHSFYFPPVPSAAARVAGSVPIARTRVYFAAPLFSQAQWLWNLRLAKELEVLGLDVTLPERAAEPMLKGAKPFDAAVLFSTNVAGIDRADVVLAILDEPDPDSGTAWECGYAFRSGRPVVAVRTDIRRSADDPAASVNLMLSRSCSAYLQVPLERLDDFDGLARDIARAVREALKTTDGTSNNTANAKSKPIVYIASPYTKGNPELNTEFQCRVFDKMLSDGKAWPVAPLWAHFQEKKYPRPYTDWIEYDKALMARYDACVRLSAEIPEQSYKQSDSQGADAEVKFFREHGKPVFTNIDEFYKWIDARPQAIP